MALSEQYEDDHVLLPGLVWSPRVNKRHGVSLALLIVLSACSEGATIGSSTPTDSPNSTLVSSSMRQSTTTMTIRDERSREEKTADVIANLQRQASDADTPASLDGSCAQDVFNRLSDDRFETVYRTIENNEDLDSSFDDWLQSLANCTNPTADQSGTSTFFEIDRPYMVGFCAGDSNPPPVCNTPEMMRQMTALGYRTSGPLPDPENRDPSYWASLSPLQKNDYLNVRLWNLAARMGVSGGTQSMTEAEIQAEFDYMRSSALTFVENIRSGADVVGELTLFRDENLNSGAPEWLADWRLNGVIFYTLPAIAPDLISKVDAVIIYR